MIDVCNIFKEIDNSTGNFLLFSQYTNDLAKSSVDSGYNVRPSRFFCLNINSSNVNSAKTYLVNPGDSANNIIPRYFQNQFENGLSHLRPELDSSYDSFTSAIAFLGKLNDLYSSSSSPFTVQTSIVYDGVIDVESWNDGYGDIILNIPSNSNKKTYKIKTAYEGEPVSDLLESDPYETSGFIFGWSNDDQIPLNGTCQPNQSIYYNLNGSSNNLNRNTSIFDTFFEEDTSAEVPDSFTFNTILICYDIIKIDESTGDESTLYKDIPMGLYFTSKFTPDGNIGNPVTIYSNVEDALGVGSSWALRICTKFMPTPNGSLKIIDTNIESGVVTESIGALMSSTAELIKTINDQTAKSWGLTQGYRDCVAVFKNMTANVPYIKDVNGILYWFINGRNTEQPVYPQDSITSPGSRSINSDLPIIPGRM